MVTSASREPAPCCRALLKDIMVFSGASYSKNTQRGGRLRVRVLEKDMLEIKATFTPFIDTRCIQMTEKHDIARLNVCRTH